MKYFLLSFFIAVASLPLHAQTITKLDEKYGFKQFKFGMSPKMIRNITKKTATADNNPNVTEYTYNGSDLGSLYTVKVQRVTLTFYKNKLYTIMISFGSPDKEYLESEYNTVQYSLEKLFGDDWHNPSSDSQIVKGAIWQSKKVTLEHLKLDYSRGRTDGNNYLVGYVSLYENSMQERRLNDEF